MKHIAIITISVAIFAPLHAFGEEIELVQKNKTFSVKELKIKKGDSVKFTNADPFFHNIFSLSTVKTFDLGSYGGGDSKSMVFEKEGQVDVECAIHPSMQLTITVE